MSYIEIAENTLLGDLMRCVIEQIKVLPKPWDALSEAEQQDYLDRIEVQVADAVRQAVKIIASQCAVMASIHDDPEKTE